MPELLIAIGILGVFALAATRLFYATIRIGHATAQQQDAAGSFDAALGVLRADAWSAPEIAAANETAAKLGNVTWTINSTTLTRDAGDNSRPRTWPIAKGTTFIVVDGTSLVLRVPAAFGERGGDVRLVSQARVLSRLIAP